MAIKTSYLVYTNTHKKYKKNHKKINKNTKLKVRDTQFLLILLLFYFYFHCSLMKLNSYIEIQQSKHEKYLSYLCTGGQVMIFSIFFLSLTHFSSSSSIPCQMIVELSSLRFQVTQQFDVMLTVLIPLWFQIGVKTVNGTRRDFFHLKLSCCDRLLCNF